jgi:uncharacterized protein
MRLDDANEQGDVEDNRGKKTVAAVGGIGALLIGLVAAYFGIDPNVAKNVVGGLGGGKQQQNGPAPNDGMKEWSAKVLGTTNVVWREEFGKNSYGAYSAPKMELFSDKVDSGGCGVAPASVGPFYCPASKKVFIDPTFFEELENKLGGSKADFSKAYVIAHEVGHHVQNILGYNDKVEQYRRSEGENAGIRLELQADYLAGVWAHHADKKYRILEPGDVEAAIKTAKSIGDDRLQQKAKGWVSPESFNHGKSEQRYRHFMDGLKTGDSSKKKLDYFFDRARKPLDL